MHSVHPFNGMMTYESRTAKGSSCDLLVLLYGSPGRTEENRVADGPTQDGARQLPNKSRETSLNSDPFWSVRPSVVPKDREVNSLQYLH
jgi:hypothetical protein